MGRPLRTRHSSRAVDVYRLLLFAYPAALEGYSRGSDWLRQVKFSIWIGYDF